MKRRISGWIMGAAGLALLSGGMARAADVGYTFRNVAVLDSTIAGEQISGGFQLGSVNASGAVLFVTNVDTGEASFLVEPDGKAMLISKPGNTSPAGGTFGTYISNNVRLNDNGKAIVAVSVDRGQGEFREHVMYDKAANKWSAVVGHGTVGPDGGAFNQPRSYAAINNKDEIAFAAEAPDTTAGPAGIGVYRLVDGKITNVARAGTKVARGGAFVTAWWPSISDSGIVAFEGQIGDEPNVGAYLEKDGVITEIAAYGSKVPDAAGNPTSDTFAAASSVDVNSAGDAAFVGSLDSGGVGAFVYSAKDKKVRRVAGPGDKAPGSGTFTGIAAGYHGIVRIGEDGAVYFEGLLEDGVGEFRWDPADGQISTIVRTGQMMEGIGKAGEAGVGSSLGLSSDGKLVFSIQTDDGVLHLLVATPPAKA